MKWTCGSVWHTRTVQGQRQAIAGGVHVSDTPGRESTIPRGPDSLTAYPYSAPGCPAQGSQRQMPKSHSAHTPHAPLPHPPSDTHPGRQPHLFLFKPVSLFHFERKVWEFIKLVLPVLFVPIWENQAALCITHVLATDRKSAGLNLKPLNSLKQLPVRMQLLKPTGARE